MTKITVNGREYDSIDQMPSDIREAYLLAMADMAKMKQTLGVVTGGATPHTVVRESFTYNGREYRSRDELPPEARALFDKMPALSPGEKKTEVIINTSSRTVYPGQHLLGGLSDIDETPPEKVPAIAWLLVKILAVIVVILLVLLYLSSLKSRG